MKSEALPSSAGKPVRFAGLVLLLVMLCVPLFPASDPSEASFRALQKSSTTMDKDNFEKAGSLFIKKYPASSRVPDVKLMLADKETDTEIALEKYRSVIRNYSKFPGREYALYRVCQILDLKSKWKELRTESANGIRLFPAGGYLDDFRFMHITAALMLEDYDTAKEEAVKITEHTHDFETLSRAIFLLAEAERRISGNSKSYIYNLKELAAGFSKSEIYPSVLYRLAVFYDEKKDYDRAYSAYSDIAGNYPDSPEADLAIQRIEKLKKLKPKKVNYMPDSLTVENTEDMDISPEYELEAEKNETYYSVSIGPFTRLKDAAEITALLKNYSGIRRVKTAYGYMLYLGRHDDSESALGTRIRLAEEFGINGNIVRFSEHDKKSYIYEDR